MLSKFKIKKHELTVVVLKGLIQPSVFCFLSYTFTGLSM